LVEIFLSAQKTFVAAEGGRKKQNAEFRRQNSASENSKKKSQNHKQLLSDKSGKSLFN
jgi:hypothetical protein